MRNALLILLFACLAYTQGCAVGYDSVLFVTKSNVGINVDSTPPAAEISISRVEGVIEPTFEDGGTLPVMASFKFQSQGLFSGGVSQTLSTGDAALAMAVLYDTDFHYDPTQGEWKRHIAEFDSAIEVSQPPQLPHKLKFISKDVKPVCFGTTTSLGVNATWSTMTSPAPDSVHIGYRRKELAMAPIALEQKDSKPKLRAPSLLGTIDWGAEVGASANTNLRWLQYFATGKSATALALRPEVRKAMLMRLDPKQFAEVLGNKSTRAFGINMLANVYLLIDARASDRDENAKKLKSDLDALGKLAPNEFDRYTWAASSATLSKTTWPLSGTSPNHDFNYAVSYWKTADTSINALGTVVGEMDKDPNVAFQFKDGANPSAAADDAVKKTVRQVLSTQTKSFEEFDKKFRQSAAARNAADYVRDLFK